MANAAASVGAVKLLLRDWSHALALVPASAAPGENAIFYLKREVRPGSSLG